MKYNYSWVFMLPNWFPHIGAVQGKACAITPNVLKISNSITANGSVTFTAINAKLFTIDDLAVNADPTK